MEYSKEFLERAKMAVDVYSAILEQKEIEIKNVNGDWVTLKSGVVNINQYDYRVKPEPKYIPFTFEDANDLMAKTIKSKEGESLIGIIVMCTSTSVYYGSDSCCKYGYLFQNFTFMDGTPCGKLVNQ